MRVVRAFGRERDELKKFREKNNTYTNIWMRLCDMLTVFWTLGDIMSMIQVFGVIAMGVHMCVFGRNHAGYVSGFCQLHAPAHMARSARWDARCRR